MTVLFTVWHLLLVYCGNLMISYQARCLSHSPCFQPLTFHDWVLFLSIVYESFYTSQKKLIIELVKIQNDGTVEVDIDENAPVASELLELHSVEGASFYVNESISGCNKPIPRLKVAMLVVGTRGDVQPFLAIAKRLQACS